jgi:N6-adenosine-specific RNA methylase IME4
MTIRIHEEDSWTSDVTIIGSVTVPTIRVRCFSCGKPFPAFRRSAKTCSPACRQRLSRDLRAATPPLPSGRFQLLVADPPWSFASFSEKGQGKSPSCHYTTMQFDAIRRLRIQTIAARDAGLALWVYGPMLPKAIELMKHWGFDYKSDLITWVKTTSAGKLAFGTGYYTRKGTEQLLYGTRGRGLKVVDRSIRQCLLAPRHEHSRKPDEVAKALEQLFGPVHRIELFARRMRAGWTCWGNELPERK